MTAILIIDDSLTTTMSLKSALDMAGFAVTACNDGPTALGHIDRGYRPDMVITDIRELKRPWGGGRLRIRPRLGAQRPALRRHDPGRASITRRAGRHREREPLRQCAREQRLRCGQRYRRRCAGRFR